MTSVVQQLMRQFEYTMFITDNHAFTSGERKIWSNIQIVTVLIA